MKQVIFVTFFIFIAGNAFAANFNLTQQQYIEANRAKDLDKDIQDSVDRAVKQVNPKAIQAAVPTPGAEKVNAELKETNLEPAMTPTPNEQK